MLRLKSIASSILLVTCLTTGSSGRSQDTAPQLANETATGLDQVIRRVVTREKSLVEGLRNYNPIIETYIQRQVPDEGSGAAVPREDEYLLGRLDWQKGVKTKPLLRDQWKAGAILGSMSQPFPFQADHLLDVFAGMTLVDKASFDEKRYAFRYVRREFLGEVRCLVFEVTPERKARDGFSGRIWVEDKDYTIVRFNGVNASRQTLHFDSWRLNVRPGLWVPAYVYTEDSDQGYGFMKRKPSRAKAQTRLWGYSLTGAGRKEEFTAVLVDPAVQDRTDSDKQASPLRSQRAWERQAEDNVLERLEAAGMLAPEGEVDKVLKTVVTNLEITNNLDIDPEVRCRVLLTSPLEAFSVGHTIVLSRGLIDVLPDEASLAAMLAHELGHILLGHRPIDTKYAFSDRMLVPDSELLDGFRFRRKPGEESAADLKAMEILKPSPYKDKLGNAGLFLRAVAMRVKQLPNLIQAHMGDGIAREGGTLRMSDLMNSAPKLEVERIDQIAALPLGTRVDVDPWSGRLQLMKSGPLALVSAREKMPLEVTPFMLYLTYSQAANDSPARSSLNPTPP